MSQLTAEMMGQTVDRRRAKRWNAAFARIADRLVATFGVPNLGNFADPVEEVFYIMLSARTTDAKYRKTHTALRTQFPTLAALSAAKLKEIVPCLLLGGLANKRAAHARGLATAFLCLRGDPSNLLRRMSAAEAFTFLAGLPGMGPKSALCVMMYSLRHDVFPVDANVQRVATRIGAIPPGLKHYQAQKLLPPLVPDGRSKELHIGMVVLGRQVCLAREPRCGECPIWRLCKTGQKRDQANTRRRNN